MARFDVYRNPRKETARQTPYLLDVQSDFLEDLDTRVVVPLRAAGDVGKPVTRLNPTFEIGGAAVVMDTPQIVGYPRRPLKRPVANLRAKAFEIQQALDFLFTGI
jgi:toxin CcdB